MNHVIEKIRSFADLAEGWDSYGASEISDTAMNTAIKAVEYLDDMALDEAITVNAFPLCTGMVQLDIDCYSTGRGVEVECDKQGGASVSYFDANNEVVKSIAENVHCDTIERFLLDY